MENILNYHAMIRKFIFLRLIFIQILQTKKIAFIFNCSVFTFFLVGKNIFLAFISISLKSMNSPKVSQITGNNFFLITH